MTVCLAVTAAPIIAPDVPLIPLGRSTATIDARLGVHRLDHRARRPLDRSVEPGAEQGIDYDIRTIQAARVGGCNHAVPLFCGERRVAPEPAYVPDEEDLHAIASLGEKPRCDKTIAPVIARAGHDDDDDAGGMAGSHCVGNGAAGPLHQVDARRTAGNCQTVGLRHLVIAQKLDHAVLKIIKAAGAAYRRA